MAQFLILWLIYVKVSVIIHNILKDNKQIEVASDISNMQDVSGTDECIRKVKTPKSCIFR